MAVLRTRRGRGAAMAIVCAIVAAAVLVAGVETSASSAGAPGRRTGRRGRAPRRLGIRPGKIKHVWLIILENKSYDATFTGLNNNTYLWQTLPSQGVLLKNYYGTGHFSLDNYVSLVSGQATQPDTQADCPYYDAFRARSTRPARSPRTRTTASSSPRPGPNAAAGSNGCVYPASVPTLFNQLDAAQGRAGRATPRISATPTRAARRTTPARSTAARRTRARARPASTAQANPGSANATDQYVPKHFPFPWFESILLQSGRLQRRAHRQPVRPDATGSSTTCRASRRRRRSAGSRRTTAATPTTPSATATTSPAASRTPTRRRPPLNYTGGLYASDLFLEHVIPEIEASPAFKDGGLIDVTFDEAFPPFTYTGNSFANSTTDRAERGDLDRVGLGRRDPLRPRRQHRADRAEHAAGRPTPSGNQLYPGPGDNAFVDRPSNCVAQTVPAQPAGTCLLGGGSHRPGRADRRRRDRGRGQRDDHRQRDRGNRRRPQRSPAPASRRARSSARSPTRRRPPASSRPTRPTSGSSRSSTSTGKALDTTGAVERGHARRPHAGDRPAVRRHRRDERRRRHRQRADQPVHQARARSSTVYYNHYSWLRTMEDLFNVGRASPGLDGEGHIGYAAQPGLAPFGPDVFNNPAGEPLDARPLIARPQPSRRGASRAFEARLPPVVRRSLAAALVGGARRRRRSVGALRDAAPAPRRRRLGAQVRAASRAGCPSRRSRSGGRRPRERRPPLARDRGRHRRRSTCPAGGVLATAVGPAVPDEGAFPVPATTPCSLHRDARRRPRAPCRSAPSAFTILDELGHLHRPRVTTAGGGSAAARACAPGRTLDAHGDAASCPTGNGRLRWAPAGAAPIVSWDFDVEID